MCLTTLLKSFPLLLSFAAACAAQDLPPRLATLELGDRLEAEYAWSNGFDRLNVAYTFGRDSASGEVYASAPDLVRPRRLTLSDRQVTELDSALVLSRVTPPDYDCIERIELRWHRRGLPVRAESITSCLSPVTSGILTLWALGRLLY